MSNLKYILKVTAIFPVCPTFWQNAAAQYAGGVYDQGGYIYAAGMVLSNELCAFVFGR